MGKERSFLKLINQDKLQSLRIIHCVFGFEIFTVQCLHALPTQLLIENKEITK